MAYGAQIKRHPGFASSGFFVLRTPLLAFDELIRWGECLKTSEVEVLETEQDAAFTRQAWKDDVQVLRTRLQQIVDRPEVLQSLFVASPSLESAIENWKRSPDNKKGLQAERALVRYLARMSGRPTPFGLFSGCSVGRVDTSGNQSLTEFVLQPLQRYRSCSRLDFDYLFALTHKLRRDPAIACDLRYWPNSSLQRIGDSLHYIESRINGTRRSHHVVRLDADEYLNAILDRAETGATIANLTQALFELGGTSELSEEEIKTYLQELIDSEVLVSSLSPLLTGGSPLDDIIAQLDALPNTHHGLETLRSARDAMGVLDGAGLGVAPAEYRAIATRLEALPGEVNIAHLFQVDLTKPLQIGNIAQPLIDELEAALQVLLRVGHVQEPEELRLFRDAFSVRYERAWVPLLEALDPDAGVGFRNASDSDGSPLLRGLVIGDVRNSSGDTIRDWRASLLDRIMAGTGEHPAELELGISELPVNDSQFDLVPDAFAVVATIVARSSSAINRGDFRILLKGVLGPSGARLFGRFCHADPELDRFVRTHLREEESYDKHAVYAEIIYLPEGRVGNILCRPVLRDYEITYLGRSGAPKDRQVPVSDLLVTIEESKIVLYSRRLRRRIIPRLTNAHGFMNPAFAPVYRFLAYLQHQGGVNVPAFSWGQLDSLHFLPRVRVNRTVLACARWRLTRKELEKFKERDRFRCYFEVQQLRRSRGLPRWIVLQEADNALPVDLDNPLCVDALVHVLKRLPEAILQEMYPSPDELCVTGPEGRFQHELLVPFVRKPLMPEVDGAHVTNAERRAHASGIIFDRGKRSFPPGSDWLFVKLYGGAASLDEALTSVVHAVVRKALESGVISRWFFIRYADPHQHLRIRFHGLPNRLRQELLPHLQAFNDLIMRGNLWKLQFDTYEREIERYGGVDGICTAEEIFCADSEAVLEILQSLQGDEGLDTRWRIAILGSDRLLSDCGFHLETKRKVIGRLRSSCEREFRIGLTSRKQIGDRFRRERRSLEALLGKLPEGQDALGVATRAFERRSARIARAVRELQSSRGDGRLEADIEDLAGDYVHMHINRLMRSAPRAHELVLYDFLTRIYDGQRATRGAGSDSATGHLELKRA